MTRTPSAISPRVFLLVLAVLLMGGCASTPAGRPGPQGQSPDPLFPWVDEVLAPYLVERLGEHPRFKGETVLLVAMDGMDVEPRIDGLRASIRERLEDHLLRHSGSSLVWRPTQPPWAHPTAPRPVRCHDDSRITYYVGIDISRLPDGRHRISVRALDRPARAWVPGFGESWEGYLSTAQRLATTRVRTDEYLRGLRVLPFEGHESDLLAAYVARNLSCRLRAQGLGEQSLAVETPPGASPGLEHLMGLVANYLRRESGLRLAAGGEPATLRLGGELKPVDGRLHQLWLTVRARPSDPSLRPFDTDAYVRLAPAARAEELAAVAPHALLSPLRLVAAPRGVEFELQGEAHLFLLAHRQDGSLARVDPGACGGASRHGPRRHRVSLRQVQGGIESIYALATPDAATAAAIRRHLREVPADCPRQPAPAWRPGHRWLEGLAVSLEDLEGRLEWEGVRGPGAAAEPARASWEENW